MKVIYLAAFQANHPNFDVTYQDINGKRDIGGDMLDVDLTPYDVIIATPPCNYYSRANWRRETSIYSQNTKHLLPSIMRKLSSQDKPFIIENVINLSLMDFVNDCPVFTIQHGRHLYFTNVPFNPWNIPQSNDFDYKPLKSGKTPGRLAMWAPREKRQGGSSVHAVIDYWLQIVKEMYFNANPL